MNTPSNSSPNQVSGTIEKNEQYDAIGQELYIKLYQYDTPPNHKIEFKDDFGSAHKIQNYYQPGVKEAFQEYVLAHYGIKVGYHDESRGFGLSIQDYDSSKGFLYPILKKHLNVAIAFIKQAIQNRGEVVFGEFQSRPQFFEKIVSELLKSVGYVASFKNENGNKKRVYFEKHNQGSTLDDLSHDIAGLQALKALLDKQQDYKAAAESIETEFSKNTIAKLNEADFGIIAVSQDMMDDAGFPGLLAEIKKLQKQGKTIVFFELDKIPSDMGINGVLPSRFTPALGNKPWRGLDGTTLSGILQDGAGLTFKKGFFGQGKKTAIISYSDQDKQDPFFKHIKLNFVQIKMLGCEVIE